MFSTVSFNGSLLHLLQLRIWDFSGQTTQYFLNDKDKGTLYSQMQVEQDVSSRRLFVEAVITSILKSNKGYNLSFNSINILGLNEVA